MNDTFAYIFQSFFMLLRNVFVYDELLNPNPLVNNVLFFSLLFTLFKAFIIGVCIDVTRKKSTNDFLSFALWITASLLISPNGSSYSLVLLIISFLAIATETGINLSKQKTTNLIFAALLLFLLCNIPMHVVASWPVLLKFPRLYLLILLWFLLMKLSRITFDYRIFIILFIVLMIPESIKLFSSKQSESNYLLKKEEHILCMIMK